MGHRQSVHLAGFQIAHPKIEQGYAVLSACKFSASFLPTTTLLQISHNIFMLSSPPITVPSKSSTIVIMSFFQRRPSSMLSGSSDVPLRSYAAVHKKGDIFSYFRYLWQTPPLVCNRALSITMGVVCRAQRYTNSVWVSLESQVHGAGGCF
jgi:hypothetical protein